MVADLVLGGACREAARRFAGKYGEVDRTVVVGRIVAALESLSKGQHPEPEHESSLNLRRKHPAGNEHFVEDERLRRMKCRV